MKDLKWRFVTNNNGTINGINDAGIETFTPNRFRSLVRETIQNSLDVCRSDTKPVRVEFSRFDLPANKFPDIDTFRDAISKCKKSNADDPVAREFFENAEHIMNKDAISILRVSDYNTSGLLGADTAKKGTRWSGLVKEEGSSNGKNGFSGGSFGIGKSVFYLISGCRTVFFSSLDEEGYKSNIGVAKLVSFEDKGTDDWTSGIGFYSEDERFVAIPELASFDKSYRRDEPGTDIYIVGAYLTTDYVDVLVRAVLLDFMVSIVNDRLEVVIGSEVINKKTLPKYIASLNEHESKEIKDLIEYYHLITSKDPSIHKVVLDANVYGKEYGFKDGECTLYVREHEGLNRKILITRKTGMRIYEQDRISGMINFSGVLVMDGPNMNEKFRKMEVPSHDAFEPERVTGKEKYYGEMLSGFRKYLKETVKTLFEEVSTTSIDAYGAGDFLPDTSEPGNEKEAENELSTKIKSINVKEVVPSTVKVSDTKLAGVLADEDGRDGKSKDSNLEKEDLHSVKTGGASQSEESCKDGYVGIDVRKRLIGKDVMNGKYLIKMVVPSNATKAKLLFSLSAEQSDIKLPVFDAKVVQTGRSTTVDSVAGNAIYLKDVVASDVIVIEATMDYNEDCMMEVGYYEKCK